MEKMPPPDGGCRAVSVVVGSFLCNGLIFGLVNSYSVLNDELVKIFDNIGEQNARSKAGTYTVYLTIHGVKVKRTRRRGK